MLMGHTDGLSESRSSRDQLLPYAESDLGDDDTADCSEPILYSASFEELAKNIVKYDTVIWFSISLMLVLAWGVGIIMLLYLPFKRYILQKDISSRKLYVTPSEIVYKVSRPSYVPFLGITTIERHVPLSLVIDIIIEQGCLQSKYGLHTFRIESIARGKAAAVDELQVQGVSNPSDLRKVIISEASKVIQDSSISWKPTTVTAEGESIAGTPSVTEAPILRSPAKSVKMAASPRYASIERRSILPSELLLNRLEEVNKSVKKIEFLIEKSHTQPE
ncbi:hypothetical protein RchiOBHm_Chr1g0353101 [Rosa chinensis]|uniref:DUF7642 domain-containing protein n=2 Tax=Rosa chinensis TaxID=74649 RepID=A0A2P6SGQ3_ROSCH|nr:uncharacterized protein LOC112181408 [Rosa chinensis]XP_024180426.1 uncharacterized protein LOC112186296 isoform X2 [Rosa chinensis]PRQ57875.1 hypothetical protein RchiOBHm_Chr1g0353101 [Rosa chinensis]